MSKNKVRLIDIAQACNVSVSTASRALREDPQIATETRVRIIAEARRQNYKASLAALANAVEQRNRSNAAIACKHLAIIEHGNNIRMFFSEALVEMSHVCNRIGTETTFVSAQADESLTDCLKKATAIGPDAVILMTWDDLSEEDARLFDEMGIPVVLFNRYIAGYGNAVTLDNYSAGVRIVRYLYNLGHRRIAHIAGENTSPAVRERAEGARAELERLSCYDPQLFSQVQRTRFVDTINDSVRKFLSLSARATAIWAYNDASAAIAYTAVRAAGLTVPGDISIAGFDHMAQVRDLNLTTFDYRIAEMGRVAVNMAGNLVAGVIEGPQRVCVVPTFIEGATTGPAR